jgi:hypothetical protein
LSWIKLDDKFWRNPKQLRMSDEAHRVYVNVLSYCGDVPEPTGFMLTEEARGLVRSMGKTHRVIDELLSLNAWESVPDGYLIHDFADYVAPKSTERVRRHRELRRAGVDPETQVKRFSNSSETQMERVGNVSGALQERFSNVSSHARAHPVPEPVPEPGPDTGISSYNQTAPNPPSSGWCPYCHTSSGYHELGCTRPTKTGVSNAL